jgi:hypothetical protein
MTRKLLAWMRAGQGEGCVLREKMSRKSENVTIKCRTIDA